MNLTEFLRSYRALSKTEEGARLARMFMLVELHPLRIVWQTGGHTSWNEFLRSEHLCPTGYFATFEEATWAYKKPVIERIGCDAAVALLRTEPHLRSLTLKRIDTFIKTHSVKPHIRQVYAFVRALRQTVVVRKQGKSNTAYVTRH